jgi:hypothetical protein
MRAMNGRGLRRFERRNLDAAGPGVRYAGPIAAKADLAGKDHQLRPAEVCNRRLSRDVREVASAGSADAEIALKPR